MKLLWDSLNIQDMKSHPARGAWIEITVPMRVFACRQESHPARGAWIEMRSSCCLLMVRCRSHPARGAWIEIPECKEGRRRAAVAPRTGCVD